ncbi:hypothetical protein [Paenibacillus macerans]|uniref:hypothetical protein n=1 Tax=Paenibacillus macerans TaxID=44252 RepID=UPI00203E8A8E|nr:hypothetical protein [Paenibacillus macerans]MCM3699029.1 hypothetical protein [Paenibacillus macerans]
MISKPGKQLYRFAALPLKHGSMEASTMKRASRFAEVSASTFCTAAALEQCHKSTPGAGAV